MERDLSEATYGSDKVGLVCAYVFGPDSRGRAIDADEAARRLDQRQGETTDFLWLHFRLLNRPTAWLTEADLIDLRQSAEELSAATADSGALVERVRLLQEELMALLNERTNRTLFILTVVTVLALPMTIIPGMFGMNVGGVPFSTSPAGFWTVVVLVVTVAAVGVVVAFRRRE